MKDSFKLKISLSHEEFIEDFYHEMKRVCFVEELRENLIFTRSDFKKCVSTGTSTLLGDNLLLSLCTYWTWVKANKTADKMSYATDNAS